MAPHENKGKGICDNLQLLRQEGSQVQDLLGRERVRDNRPHAQKGAGKQEQGGIEPVLKQDACVPGLRQAQEHSEEEKVAFSRDKFLSRSNNKKGVTLQMECMYFGAEIAEKEAEMDSSFGELVSSYLEPYTFEDYVDDNPENLPNRPYTFKSAEESEPERIYEGLPEEEEYAKSPAKKESEEEDSEEEIPLMEEPEGAFLADETIFTHGSV